MHSIVWRNQQQQQRKKTEIAEAEENYAEKWKKIRMEFDLLTNRITSLLLRF